LLKSIHHYPFAYPCRVKGCAKKRCNGRCSLPSHIEKNGKCISFTYDRRNELKTNVVHFLLYQNPEDYACGSYGTFLSATTNEKLVTCKTCLAFLKRRATGKKRYVERIRSSKTKMDYFTTSNIIGTEEVKSMRENGFTFREIGDILGVSKQRAYQIFSTDKSVPKRNAEIFKAIWWNGKKKMMRVRKG